jgi:hypothetical protein
LLAKLKFSLVWLGASLVGVLSSGGGGLVKDLTLLSIDEILIENVLELLVK